MPNYQQVFLPTDGAYGNEEAGNIKREVDKINEVSSNGGVHLVRLVRKRQSSENMRDDNIGTTNEFQNLTKWSLKSKECIKIMVGKTQEWVIICRDDVADHTTIITTLMDMKLKIRMGLMG